MSKIRSFSFIETIDGSLWYSCGPWSDPEFPDSVLCILGYVQEGINPSMHTKVKVLEINGKIYFKTSGVPMSLYRRVLSLNAGRFISGEPLGKAVFVRKSHIARIKDPKDFVPVFLQGLQKRRIPVIALAKILGLELEDIGITGSSLLFEKPVSRHELDIAIYSMEKSQGAQNMIQKNRDGELNLFEFSQSRNFPFLYKGVWFDMQFAEADDQNHYLNGCHVEIIDRHQEKIEIKITKSDHGIFFPAFYGIEDGHGLFSFRLGHRGLFKEGQVIVFDSISVIRITYPDGAQKTFYAILNDEWGRIIK